MTTCTPLKPFRCWQYSKDATVPEWADWVDLTMANDGEWLVEDQPRGLAHWYTPAEFAERFRVEEGK
jgi:hypothetical protein